MGFRLTMTFLIAASLFGQTVDHAAFDATMVDLEGVRLLAEAWRLAGFGTQDHEEVVLFLAQPDGSLRARRELVQSGHKTATFRWDPRIRAVFHTHPNTGPMKPTTRDCLVAERYRIPIFTLTSRGIWGYFPESGKLKRVMKGLTWLEMENWPTEAVHPTLSGHQRLEKASR